MDPMNRDEAGFFEKCDEAKKFALSFKDPLIVHHYDADGVSSGALIAGAFREENRKYRMRCIRKLDDFAISEVEKEKEIIFVDLGGGNKRVNELGDVLVIDHHQTEGIEKFQINPLLFGIDGGHELSAASTAYCVFRKFADLAIVGATGDMQSPMIGMNKWVVEEGVRSGEIKIETDLRFYGRYCRPLVQFLAYSDDPYIPGISFREDRAAQLLDDLKIKTDYENENGSNNNQNNKKTYSDLSLEEKQKLVSSIASVLANSSGKKIELVGESYIFPYRPKNETYEANEFSTLLNACGRHNKPELGIKVCLGDQGAHEEARKLLALHRKMLREGIEFALGSVQDFGKFYFLDGRGIVDESIVGIVCGMIMGQRAGKLIVGISSSDNDMIKISGRATKATIAKGVNVGNLMREASVELGGVGGGHVMAAGASISKTKINEFLVFVSKYLAKVD
ncbi:DHH family phosphoesterase [Candidatus Micrarchaeota archaeon]|nr:DHH family phosphoesterase [Candidatus Micrarchaeota archaeon]